MSNSDLINEIISEDPEALARANVALENWTRRKIYVLDHIPFKWMLILEDNPDAPRLVKERARLFEEMRDVGCICLDAAGEPACLSGRPPVALPSGERVTECGEGKHPNDFANPDVCTQCEEAS